ncbi:MAG TPA: GTP cyclohydrolase MptA [Candidatus Tyrphobacter sp.]
MAVVHRAYLGIGSNLGDRRANILAALQRLRASARIDAVSAFYESPPAQGAEGPAFLNVAAALDVSEERETFARRLEEVQRSVGRLSTRRLAARPIDLDLLAFDEWEHPQLAQRPYNLVPLAEIAAAYVARARTADGAAMRRLDHGLRFRTDRQTEVPEVRIALNRAGVARVRRTLHLEIDGKPRVLGGEFAMVADLSPDRAGVHMSRFVEILEEATLDVLAREQSSMRVERLVEAVAREIVATQEAGRADVRLRAEFGLERWTPVSGKRGEETYTLIGIAHANARGTRRVVGVEAEGMTACPCAQGMMREHSMLELRDAGFSEREAERALDVLPVATHNQRGRGIVLLGVADDARMESVRIEDLVEIVESSMSSETYDLLKRPDEFFVVNKAHRNPKFVEDVVRGIVARTLETYPELGDETFVFASQRNEESIHKHDAFAEAFGRFGEFREELSGATAMPRTDLAAWLGTRPSPLLI